MSHSYKEVQYKCEECGYCGNKEVSMEVHVSKVHFEKKSVACANMKQMTWKPWNYIW